MSVMSVRAISTSNLTAILAPNHFLLGSRVLGHAELVCIYTFHIKDYLVPCDTLWAIISYEELCLGSIG